MHSRRPLFRGFSLRSIPFSGVVASVVLVSVSGLAQAPSFAARLRVLTHNENDQPIAKAEIQLKTKDVTIVTRTTDSQGIGEFTNLPFGTYELVVSKTEFQTIRQEDVLITAGPPVEIEFTLSPSVRANEEVRVEATPDSPVEQGASPGTELERDQLKQLPGKPATVSDALPLVPGVVRTADGEIEVSGAGEHHSALLVNSADVTDPGTGQMGITVPVDMVETINVLQTPYLAQYGRFTAGVVSVETRRGGDRWHYELNDPVPEFRIRSYHLTGLRAVSPRLVLNGPLIRNRFYFAEGLEYVLRKQPVKTLYWPFNESTERSVNSFTQLDYIFSPKHMWTGTFHVVPRSINFANLDAFDPQSVTPNFQARDYTTTLIDRLTIRGEVLQSTLAIKRFRGNVWAQGTAPMLLTPTGNGGNYFSDQNRSASRVEWLETLSFGPIESYGMHNVILGTTLTRADGNADIRDRSVNILDGTGQLVKRIDFLAGSPVGRTDLEVASFVQDHWILNSKMNLDTGLRFERQGITDTSRLAPRIGFAWTPFSERATVVRGGAGVFYDRVPLNVYAFPNFPEQMITTYGADGNVLDGPRHFGNLIGRAVQGRFALVRRDNIPGDFAPYSIAWNIQISHRISRVLTIQSGYLQSNSYDMVLVTPSQVQGQDALLLTSGGRSRYRQFELTAHVAWKEGQQFYFSYVRSRAQGDLNEFNNYIGNFPRPVIPPNHFAELPSDVPNHFIFWGQTRLPRQLRLSAVLEYRNGFPYQPRDVAQNYVSLSPSLTRFPNFFAMDLSIARDFRVSPKYVLTITGRAFNLTDHFNALAVHNNTADPQFGTFFGTYPRRFRLDFDVNF